MPTFAYFNDVNPELGTYKAKAYTSHDASATVRAGTCAIKILSKEFDEDGSVKSIDIIYKSSRSEPKEITLHRTESGEMIGCPFQNQDAYTSENPVIEMVGSDDAFGILISTNKTAFAAAVGMDGERSCHNFEENPITEEEFENY